MSGFIYFLLLLATFISASGHDLRSIHFTNSKSPRPREINSLRDSVDYLVKYGYLKNLEEVKFLLKPHCTTTQLEKAVQKYRKAICTFQRYAKLPLTGQFDASTRSKMNVPRCGVEDISKEQFGTKASLRYIVTGQMWRKKRLTYRISQYSQSNLPRETIKQEIDRAFLLWSNVTNLCFVKAEHTQEVDINIQFVKQEHGDSIPFGGPGEAVAHAFPPNGEPNEGNIHFDDEEDWTSGKLGGINFFSVAVHEIGHAIGLRHSDQMDAVMYAFPQEYTPSFQLSQDDIKGIQSIYGKRDYNYMKSEAQPL